MKVGATGFQPEQSSQSLVKNTKQEMLKSIAQDSFSFSRSITVASRIYHQKIAENLPFKMPEPAKPEQLFDFEEVAKNVLSFVKGAILGAKSDGKDDDYLKTMFEQARNGVQKGIDDAIGELEDSDLMNDDISNGIDKSKELIFAGIDEFESSLFNTQNAGSSMAVGMSYQLENNAQYTIETAEGDKITLTYNGAYSNSQAAAYRQNEQGEEFVYASETSTSRQFAFTVEGDLNDDEKEAINALMADLQEVSDEFFNGSLDDAFEKAKELSLDSSQLVSMSMNLQQKEVRSSVKQYQQSMPGTEIAKQFEPLNEPLESAYNRAEPFSIQDQLPSLMAWLNQTRENAKNLLDYSSALFDKLSEQREQDTE